MQFMNSHGLSFALTCSNTLSNTQVLQCDPKCSNTLPYAAIRSHMLQYAAIRSHTLPNAPIHSQILQYAPIMYNHVLYTLIQYYAPFSKSICKNALPIWYMHSPTFPNAPIFTNFIPKHFYALPFLPFICFLYAPLYSLALSCTLVLHLKPTLVQCKPQLLLYKPLLNKSYAF